MNNSPPIPPLVSIPPEGYGAAFDYDYWRWYFFSLDNNDYMWVLSQNEWLAVNRILAFRTDEVWSFADSPDQSAFTEYITWLIEMNILTDETAHTIANISYDNPTMYPQGRTMMGFYPPPKPYYQTQEDPVNEKIPENNSNWDNCGAIGEKLDDWKTAESYTGWEFNTPLKTPKQETPLAPKKVKKYKSPLSRPAVETEQLREEYEQRLAALRSDMTLEHASSETAMAGVREESAGDENPRAVDDPYWIIRCPRAVDDPYWKVGGWEAVNAKSPLSRPEPSYSHSDENPRAADDPYWKVGGWEAAHSQSLPPNYVSSEATNWDTPETPPPRKNLEQSIADMLDYETISNTTSSQ